MTSRLRFVLAVSTSLGAALLAGVAEAQQNPPTAPADSSQAAAPPATGGPGASSAQSETGPAQSANGTRGPMAQRAMLARLAGMQPADRGAIIDARLAAIKAGLELTPDQEKLWPPIDGAIRDGINKALELRQKSLGQQQGADPMQRLNQTSEAATARADTLKRFVEAAQPLYASLTPDQKRRLPMLMGVANSIGQQGQGGAQSRGASEGGEQRPRNQARRGSDGERSNGREPQRREQGDEGARGQNDDEAQGRMNPTWRGSMRQRMETYGNGMGWRGRGEGGPQWGGDQSGQGRESDSNSDE